MSKKNKKVGIGRSAARLAAVQTLYSMGITGHSAEDALIAYDARIPDDTDPALVRADRDIVGLLVRGAAQEQERLDVAIGQALTGDWSMDRLESVLLAILRVGAYEVIAHSQTPVRVAISEYVDVAHAFYAGAEPKMVNAVLDRIARVVRPEEFVSDVGA